MKLKKFSEFTNEAGQATQAQLTAAGSAAPNPGSAVKTPSGLMIKAVYDNGKGGLRVIGSKGNIDYKINIALPAYKGPVMPVNFWRNGDTYYIKTNAGQVHDFSQEDVNHLLDLYKSGGAKKTIDGWVADVTFTKTSELKDIS